MPGFKNIKALAFALGALFIVTGCGPGFPIMTGEQAALVDNVDKLLKDNADLKKRLAAIEGGAGNNEIAEVRKALAETSAEIEELRGEFRFVQGTIEEGDHVKDAFKESFDSFNEATKATNDRLAGIEETTAENTRRLDELTSSIEELKKGASAAPAPSPEKTEPPTTKPAPGAESAPDVYARGYKQTMDKDYPAALKTFRRFLATNKGHELADNAQYWIGEIYYARGSWERAILEFNGVIKDYPKGDKIAGALLKQGFAFENLGSKKEARVLLEEVVEKYPGSREAELAKKRLKELN